jgi:hypothetical protein
MTKVEELADKLGYYIEPDDIGSGDSVLEDLLKAYHEEITSAHAEGVEEERERIRQTVIPVPCFGGMKYYLSDYSVLAPTKEKP